MNAVARTLVESLAMMGIQGTLLALVALGVVRGGRLRPGWQAAVWLVVLVKFVLPWGPAMPWSLADLVAALSHHGGGGGSAVVAAAAGPAVAPHVSAVWSITAGFWLTGAAIVLARALIAQHRVVQAARHAPLAPGHAQALLASFTARPPRLVVGDPAVGPHVVGILRPIIVVPPALVGDPVLLCPALLHELAHVRRRDALARVVQLVAGAVFLFWPVVRLASRRLDLAREAACDAWALEMSEVPRPAYARLLVRMAQLQAAAAPSMGAAHGLDARVAAVLGPAAHGRLGALHGLALVAWIALALGGARTAAARGDHITCRYTPALAEALRLAHPEADRDGDGVLSRDEACAFQAELRHRVEPHPGADLVSRAEKPALAALDETLLTQPLCCNCDRSAEDSAPGAPWIEQRSDTCTSSEGVSR
ncbi:MAG TPA: M56 family metallopeptidase [Kofleriaceae bacterium]|jgi:beta-lactamase regulating signal transducer with metallopeptidase domain|nr:M56 family metallopeptidase [Kofleriaceae bacterium]